MHLSMFSPRGGWRGYPVDLTAKTDTALGNLTDDFSTVDVSARKCHGDFRHKIVSDGWGIRP